jgi:HTH-type transcriptional regulator/antitoxin HigA
MSNLDVTTVVTHWVELAETIFVPHTEVEYRRLVAFLDHLIDEVGEDETHPLASLMELVGVLIERYEDETVPELAS